MRDTDRTSCMKSVADAGWFHSSLAPNCTSEASRQSCLLVVFPSPWGIPAALSAQYDPYSNTNACSVYCPSTLLPRTGRAEFDSCLKALADTRGLPPSKTANDIFCLFDVTKGGILHVRDLAAGLAVLCDGCMAPSVVRACRLYRGADGGMGFAEISGFTTSIFKVCLCVQFWHDLWFRCQPVMINGIYL